MGLFINTPVKGIAPKELHHFIGELKIGESRLNPHKVSYLKDVFEAHMDAQSRTHPEKRITADEFDSVIQTLRRNQKEGHAVHFSDHEIDKIVEHGQKYIEHSITRAFD